MEPPPIDQSQSKDGTSNSNDSNGMNDSISNTDQAVVDEVSKEPPPIGQSQSKDGTANSNDSNDDVPMPNTEQVVVNEDSKIDIPSTSCTEDEAEEKVPFLREESQSRDAANIKNSSIDNPRMCFSNSELKIDIPSTSCTEDEAEEIDIPSTRCSEDKAEEKVPFVREESQSRDAANIKNSSIDYPRMCFSNSEQKIDIPSTKCSEDEAEEEYKKENKFIQEKFKGTNVFGRIKFSREYNSPYICISNEHNAKNVVTLMRKHWKLPKKGGTPDIILSVLACDGHSNFTNDIDKQINFKETIKSIILVENKNTWIITTGLQNNLPKLVGEAVSEARIEHFNPKCLLIGIVPKPLMNNIGRIQQEDGFSEYKLCLLNDDESNFLKLDSNHDCFIIVDDGSQDNTNAEVLMRSRITKCIIDEWRLCTPILLVTDGICNSTGETILKHFNEIQSYRISIFGDAGKFANSIEKFCNQNSNFKYGMDPLFLLTEKNGRKPDEAKFRVAFYVDYEYFLKCLDNYKSEKKLKKHFQNGTIVSFNLDSQDDKQKVSIYVDAKWFAHVLMYYYKNYDSCGKNDFEKWHGCDLYKKKFDKIGVSVNFDLKKFCKSLEINEKEHFRNKNLAHFSPILSIRDHNNNDKNTSAYKPFSEDGSFNVSIDVDADEIAKLLAKFTSEQSNTIIKLLKYKDKFIFGSLSDNILTENGRQKRIDRICSSNNGDDTEINTPSQLSSMLIDFIIQGKEDSFIQFLENGIAINSLSLEEVKKKSETFKEIVTKICETKRSDEEKLYSVILTILAEQNKKAALLSATKHICHPIVYSLFICKTQKDRSEKDEIYKAFQEQAIEIVNNCWNKDQNKTTDLMLTKHFFDENIIRLAVEAEASDFLNTKPVQNLFKKVWQGERHLSNERQSRLSPYYKFHATFGFSVLFILFFSYFVINFNLSFRNPIYCFLVCLLIILCFLDFIRIFIWRDIDFKCVWSIMDIVGIIIFFLNLFSLIFLSLFSLKFLSHFSLKFLSLFQSKVLCIASFSCFLMELLQIAYFVDWLGPKLTMIKEMLMKGLPLLLFMIVGFYGTAISEWAMSNTEMLNGTSIVSRVNELVIRQIFHSTFIEENLRIRSFWETFYNYTLAFYGLFKYVFLLYVVKTVITNASNKVIDRSDALSKLKQFQILLNNELNLPRSCTVFSTFYMVINVTSYYCCLLWKPSSTNNSKNAESSIDFDKLVFRRMIWKNKSVTLQRK